MANLLFLILSNGKTAMVNPWNGSQIALRNSLANEARPVTE